jgi:hypothetical protein
MSAHRSLAALGSLAAFGAASALVLACSGSSASGGTSPEGGASAGESAAVGALCSQVTAYLARCGAASPCTQEQGTYCSTWAPSFSAAFQAGLAACIAPSGACLDAGVLFPTQECLKPKLTSPTPAQAKVKADFCAQCPDGTSASIPSSCSGFFALTVDDLGNATSVGNSVIAAGDDLAAMVDAQCTGPAAADAGNPDCARAFEACSGPIVILNANLPAACTDGLGP